MEGRSKIEHPMGNFITVSKDRSGMLRTVLKIPSASRLELEAPIEYAYPSSSSSIASSSSLSFAPDGIDRGMADGGFSDLSPSDYGSNILRQADHEDHRGMADGGPNDIQGDDDDSEFDDFSDGEPVNIIDVVNGKNFQNKNIANDSSTENEVQEIYVQENVQAVPSIGQCKAIFDYMANMYDELTIRIGDVINIHDKQEDGWWLGELNGTVGIFPATYVEETTNHT